MVSLMWSQLNRKQHCWFYLANR